jgi:hypothetical protein
MTVFVFITIYSINGGARWVNPRNINFRIFQPSDWLTLGKETFISLASEPKCYRSKKNGGSTPANTIVVNA